MADRVTANKSRHICIFDNRSEVAHFMVSEWKKLSSEAIREKGFFAAALSGGNTPRDFYKELAHCREEPDWARTHLFVADERFVPFTNADSNYGMLDDLLLSKVNIPPENRHPVSIQESSPEAAAQKYEKELRKFFRLEEGSLPEFDLIILGIGEDGHTASIFPGTETAKWEMHLALPVKLDDLKHNRITLALSVINNAKKIIFLAAGMEKAVIIKRVVEETGILLPAAMVKPVQGNLLFVLDREAGSLLSARFLCTPKAINAK